MAAGDNRREPRATALFVSVILHLLVGLAVAASSWWWGTSTLEAWKTHSVALVDAPLSLKPPASPSQPLPPKAEVKTPPLPKAPPPKAAAKAPVPPKVPAPKVPAPPKSTVKLPAPSRNPEVVKPKAKPKAKPAQAPQVASSKEARSAIETLRQRQAKREQEQQQSEAARQQAASERVAALRDQLQEQEAVGGAAVRAAGVQRVRLMAYQDRVQAQIEAAWILPLSAEQRRDLQATAQFQVTRDGQVMQLKLVKPSGNALFDASLLRAIRRASPLPAFPDDYPIDILEVEMRFRGHS